MKILASSLQSALESEVQCLAYCWKITRRDGGIIGTTSFDRDLLIDGLTYTATTGFSPTAIQADTNPTPNNVQLASILSINQIKESDLRAGNYDYARVLLFIVNCLDLPSSLGLNPPKHVALVSGTIGKVSYSDNTYTAEIVSKTQYLLGRTNWATSQTCRYIFGDSKCGVNLANYTQTVTVETVIGNQNSAFSIESISGFLENNCKGGKLTWLTGNNAEGIATIMGTYLPRELHLSHPQSALIAVGDTATLVYSCQKSESDCRRFNNWAKFGGEISLPGLDQYWSGGHG